MYISSDTQVLDKTATKRTFDCSCSSYHNSSSRAVLIRWFRPNIVTCLTLRENSKRKKTMSFSCRCVHLFNMKSNVYIFYRKLWLGIRLAHHSQVYMEIFTASLMSSV